MEKPVKHSLFLPFGSKGLNLKNRIVMAPMTRSRAFNHLPNEWISEYYCQRASAGLIISECMATSPNGLGHPRIPGIFNHAQTLAWAKITQEVHGAGGVFFAQLIHPGRIGSSVNLPEGAKITGPSVVPANVDVWSDDHGLVKSDIPDEMDVSEVKKAISEFAIAARNAVEAGFDGIELHGANGYLLEQFLNPYVNVRKDEYGGSLKNRCRFVIELVRAVAEEVGPDRVGIRFSPYNTLGNMPHYEEINATYIHLAAEMNRIGIAYIHLVDTVARLSQQGKALRDAIDDCFRIIRTAFDAVVIVNGAYTRERAIEAIDLGLADLVSFGIPFISNPDLPFRLEHDLELAVADRSVFYAPTKAGLTDFPSYC